MMKKFDDMSNGEIQFARREIKDIAYPYLRATRVYGLTNKGCTLEGGRFPAVFKHGYPQGTLIIWGRSSRGSGAQMSVDQLVQLEEALTDYFNKQYEEE